MWVGVLSLCRDAIGVQPQPTGLQVSMIHWWTLSLLINSRWVAFKKKHKATLIFKKCMEKLNLLANHFIVYRRAESWGDMILKSNYQSTKYIYIYIYPYIYIYHVVPLAQISLSLSHLSSRSFNASGGS